MNRGDEGCANLGRIDRAVRVQFPRFAFLALVDFAQRLDGRLLPREFHQRIILARDVQHGLRLESACRGLRWRRRHSERRR